MNITCNDRERIFLDGSVEECAALETHSANCALCAEEIRAWKNLSLAASKLHQEWDSPSLWPRIEEALAKQSAARSDSRWRRFFSWWNFASRNFGSWNLVSVQWQTAAAAVLLVVLTSAAIWFIKQPKTPELAQNPALLNDRAVNDVEHAEAAYERAID